MSAPDYEDPKSQLNLHLRPMLGSEIFLSLGCGLAVFSAIICLLALLASFLPNVEVDGDPLWALAGVVVFSAGAGLFYVILQRVRLMK